MTYFDDFASNFVRASVPTRCVCADHEKTAKQFVEAIKTIASKPENLENFECYLSHHFPEWLNRWASAPADLVSEMRSFAEMEV